MSIKPMMIKKREATQFRQRQIVEAVRKIVAISGMEALTIRKIAKEVNVSEGDIYRHFSSKKKIILLLIEDIERTLLETVEKAVDGKREPLHQLERVFRAHLSYAEQRRGISLIVISETLRLPDKEMRKKAYQVVNRYITRIEQLLDQGKQYGQIRNDVDTPSAAFTFFALIYAMVTLWSLSNSSVPLAKKYRPIWDSYLASITTTNLKSEKTNEKCTEMVHRDA